MEQKDRECTILFELDPKASSKARFRFGYLHENAIRDRISRKSQPLTVTVRVRPRRVVSRIVARSGRTSDAFVADDAFVATAEDC